MAAKPYHIGHHWLVNQAANENDEVLLYISIGDRKRKDQFTIHGSDMQRVWKEEIENILPSNVTPLYGGSPVKHVFDTLIEAEQKYVDGTLDDVYTIYSDVVDTAQTYNEKVKNKYFPTIYDEGLVLFAAEKDPGKYTRSSGSGAPDMSGTAMRRALQAKDFEAFEQGLPAGVNAQNIYDILSGGNINEELLKFYVKSVLF